MSQKELEGIYNYLEIHFKEHLEELKEYLRIKCCAQTGEEIREGANHVSEILTKLGGETEILELKDGNPVVYSKILSKTSNAKTVILYNKYDVVAAVEPDWVSPPFEPQIWNAKDVSGLPAQLGKVLIGRGIADSKGPQFVNYKAIEAMLAIAGDVPVNFHVIVEGEHEIGAPHLNQLNELKATKDVLKTADGFMQQSSNRGGSEKMGLDMNVAQVRLGWKGAIYCEAWVKGGDWGGPIGRDLESEDTWIDAPPWRLLWALSSLKDPSGKILIDGFFDDLRPLTAQEKEYGLQLRDTIFNEEEWKKLYEIKQFRRGLPGKDLFFDWIYKPDVQISGIQSGYTGEGIKPFFPKDASAKLIIRLQPDQDPDDIVWKVKKHFHTNGFPEVELRVSSKFPPMRAPIHSEIANAAVNALKRHGLKPLLWPSIWCDGPQGPIIHVPYANGCAMSGGHNHQSNEYGVVDTILDGAKFFATWCYEFAELLQPFP